MIHQTELIGYRNIGDQAVFHGKKKNRFTLSEVALSLFHKFDPECLTKMVITSDSRSSKTLKRELYALFWRHYGNKWKEHVRKIYIRFHNTSEVKIQMYTEEGLKQQVVLSNSSKKIQIKTTSNLRYDMRPASSSRIYRDGSWAYLLVDKNIVYKICAERGTDKSQQVRSQYRLLKRIEQNYPREVKKHFVRALHKECDEKGYSMERVPPKYKSMMYLVQIRRINAQNFRNIIKPILSFMFEQLYSRTKTTPVHADFLEKIHLNRFNRRWNNVRKTAPFQRIAKHRTIFLNEVPCKNPTTILNIIRTTPSIRKRLMPSYHSFAHGDFHFNDILVDLDKGRLRDFILVDPKDLGAYGDYAYDMGKLLHNTWSGYDLIYNDKFDFREIEDGRYEFEITDENLLSQFAAMNKCLFRLFRQLINFEEDNNFLERAFFSSAVHMLSLPFFFTQRNVEKAVVFYLIGTKQINNLYQYLFGKIENVSELQEPWYTSVR